MLTAKYQSCLQKKPKNNFKFLLYNVEVIFKFAVDSGDQTVKEELIQVIADN